KAENAAATLADPRWAAVLARDAAADGRFFYSVATTGVYCRPSCGARRPRPEHDAFHATALAADRAAVRACGRCRRARPWRNARDAALATAACRIIGAAGDAPALEELARRVGVSPRHFPRTLRRTTGLTPKCYADARRERRLREA